MSDQTGIEWADSTFNPWMGCTKVSPACDHCYAERDTARFGRVQWGSGNPRVRTSTANWKKPLQWNKQAFVECPECEWRGNWSEADERNGCCPNCNHLPRLFTPARRRVFCASLADVFDNDVDQAWRADLFALIAQTPNLDWMLLTKRIGNVPAMVSVIPGWLPSNVWIGATICNQEEADRDIPKLLAVPATVRFLSIEPMLGPINLDRFMVGDGHDAPHFREPIHWIICGGESGPNARPMHPDWVRSLRDQCAAAGVPFLFKQWGEWSTDDIDDETVPIRDYAGVLPNGDAALMSAGYVIPWDDGAALKARRNVRIDGRTLMCRVGKKSAGRMLDGVQHDGYPKGSAA